MSSSISWHFCFVFTTCGFVQSLSKYIYLILLFISLFLQNNYVWVRSSISYLYIYIVFESSMCDGRGTGPLFFFCYAARVICYVPMPRKHIFHLKKKYYKYAIHFSFFSDALKSPWLNALYSHRTFKVIQVIISHCRLTLFSFVFVNHSFIRQLCLKLNGDLLLVLFGHARSSLTLITSFSASAAPL